MFKFKGLLFNVSLVVFAIIIGAGTIMAVSANDDFVYGDCGGEDYTNFYLDADKDGFGSSTVSAMVACESLNDNYVTNNSDCDDSDENINPDADESCNGYDDNCNGEVDEGEGVKTIFYFDGDHDTYGDLNATTSACVVFGDYVENSDDCDDADASINPGVDEICGDGIDNNCSGDDAECATSTTYYADLDGDGYGNQALSISTTTYPGDGYVLNADDCNDEYDFMNPGMDEICGDGVDNNCNGNDDEECLAPITYYRDADEDGYGDPIDFISTTTDLRPDYVLNGDDCDDADTNINPGEDEICGDGVDNNCNGNDDEECVLATYYRDADEDGYGDPTDFISATTSPGSDYVLNDDDCDDTDANINPGEDEICGDGVDNNCNGNDDEECPVLITYYEDADDDGYGNPSVSTSTVAQPDGYVLDNTDCNDDNANMNPGLDENPDDGIDNDCDGRVDEKNWDPNDNQHHCYCDNDSGECACNNFGQYVSNLAHITNQWKWRGEISGKEKGQIMSQKNVEVNYSFKYKLDAEQEDDSSSNDDDSDSNNVSKGNNGQKGAKSNNSSKGKKNK